MISVVIIPAVQMNGAKVFNLVPMGTVVNRQTCLGLGQLTEEPETSGSPRLSTCPMASYNRSRLTSGAAWAAATSIFIWFRTRPARR
jgi:hypothetical protein